MIFDKLNLDKHLTITQIVIVIILINFSIKTGCDDAQDFQKNIPTRVVWTALERDVDLPCDVTPPNTNDAVKLVLWFKDSIGIPLYSLDSRGGSLKHATHAALASDLGQRLYFAVADQPRDSRLQIRNVKSIDGGVYRCRVDFFNSPTKNFRVNLTLVVPPDEPRIFDAQGNEITDVAGSFKEGYELFLSCQVTGGRPPPKVTWWREDVEISTMSHPSTNEGVPAIVNQLFISNISRDFFGTKLECRAQGSKLMSAVSKEVTIEIHLKPMRVKITTPNELLTAGRSMKIHCETWGSFPQAKITWLIDGEPIRTTEITLNNDKDDANITSSILTLRVLPDHDGAELTCRAINPGFAGGALEDKRIISVAYPPTVSIHLANEDPSRIVTRSEGQNVTLKCRADARPAVSSYSWFKNEMRMSGENTETLHLLFIERESGGSYACSAQNTEGETRSIPLSLKVQYAPRCKPGLEQTSVGALNMHSISAKCEVEADPSDFVKFSWTYNNTRNVSPVLNSRITSNGLVSTMTYMQQNDLELVTLACWASNSIGHQTSPCLVHVIPAKTPDPPRSCEFHNDTTLEVICMAGFDGGLTQHFLLEMIGSPRIFHRDPNRELEDINNEIPTINEQSSSASYHRLQEDVPQFKLHNLEPGREYQFLIYAVNMKGRSEPPIVIDRVRVAPQLVPYDATIKSEDPVPAETSNQDKQIESTIVILVAVIAASCITAMSIIAAGILALCRRRRPKPPEPQEVSKSMSLPEFPVQTDVPCMYAEVNNFQEDFMRSTDIRLGRVLTNENSPYIPEAFVQYSHIQPSLNVYITDPDLIMSRSEIEITPTGGV